MNLTSYTTGILLTLLCLCCGWLYLGARRQDKGRQAFQLKGSAALFFCALGLLTAKFSADTVPSVKIVLGLFLGLIGDELLALRHIYKKKHHLFFGLGSLAFAAGHILYIGAAAAIGGSIFRTAAWITVLYSMVSFVYAVAEKTNAGRLQIFVVFYILVVVFMAGCTSACAMVTRNTGAVLFAVGGICFAVSDNLLCAYNFGKARTKSMDIAVHASYYAAQLLIAWSIAFF